MKPVLIKSGKQLRYESHDFIKKNHRGALVLLHSDFLVQAEKHLPCFIFFYTGVVPHDNRFYVHCVTCSKGTAKKLVYPKTIKTWARKRPYRHGTWTLINSKADFTSYILVMRLLANNVTIERKTEFVNTYTDAFDEFPALFNTTMFKTLNEIGMSNYNLKLWCINLEQAKELIYNKKNTKATELGLSVNGTQRLVWRDTQLLNKYQDMPGGNAMQHDTMVSNNAVIQSRHAPIIQNVSLEEATAFLSDGFPSRAPDVERVLPPDEDDDDEDEYDDDEYDDDDCCSECGELTELYGEICNDCLDEDWE